MKRNIRFITLTILSPVLFPWCITSEARAGDHSFQAEEFAPAVATFSIVGRDPETGELGIAVASRVPAVGAIVPYAVSEVGAIATQASANPTYGPAGLELLRAGKSPQEVIDLLTGADKNSDRRQVGVLAADGRSATFTGEKCIPNAGGIAGDNFTIQGNILASDEVLKAMAEAFESADGDLGERLIAALLAGEAEGGDKRGKQSAALLVVRKGWGYGGFNDRYRDIRVDDHEEPITELQRVYSIHKRVFAPRKPPEPRQPEEPNAGGKDSG